MRRLLLVTSALLVLLAGPAVADDEVEIDERLSDAGLADAFTDYLAVDGEGGEGVRVLLDYATTASGAAEYDAEAQRAAELIWQHLEMRVHTVVVAPVDGVSWQDGAAPPPVALGRADLEAAFGSRPPGLDAGGASYFGGDGDLVLGFVALGIAAALLGAGVLGGYFWGRHRGRRSVQQEQAGPWGGPQGWGAPAGAGTWGWAPQPQPGAWHGAAAGWPPGPGAWPPAASPGSPPPGWSAPHETPPADPRRPT